MRLFIALGCGGLFGMGLVVSGMTDTQKVQGFLDLFGAWDPTLVFVMGGAILPMLLAWRIAAKWKVSALGTDLPDAPSTQIDNKLVIGGILFGAGWGLSGFCPGPAFASVSFGGIGGLVFVCAMVAAMIASKPITQRLFAD